LTRICRLNVCKQTSSYKRACAQCFAPSSVSYQPSTSTSGTYLGCATVQSSCQRCGHGGGAGVEAGRCGGLWNYVLLAGVRVLSGEALGEAAGAICRRFNHLGACSHQAIAQVAADERYTGETYILGRTQLCPHHRSVHGCSRIAVRSCLLKAAIMQVDVLLHLTLMQGTAVSHAWFCRCSARCQPDVGAYGFIPRETPSLTTLTLVGSNQGQHLCSLKLGHSPTSQYDVLAFLAMLH
jgi:hypothetical protein